MSWVIAEPKYVAINNSIVLVVDAKTLPTQLDYEGITQRAFEQFNIEAKRLGDTLFVIATALGQQRLVQIAQSADVLGPAALAKMVEDVVRNRDAIVLRWQM